jgi:hypothetical protein
MLRARSLAASASVALVGIEAQCCKNVRKFLPGRRPHMTQNGRSATVAGRSPLIGCYRDLDTPLLRAVGYLVRFGDGVYGRLRLPLPIT